MAYPIQILFLADSHLGFDLPLHPRVQRRRRGEDFFVNYRLLLKLAQEKKVDLIVHGGDIFFRSRVPPAIVDRVLEPLLEVADAGIPVYLVPGNHERSRLPPHLWWSHPNVHIFDRPKTYVQDVGDLSIALSGFPFVRKVRAKFHELLKETRHHEVQADVHFLCLHQTFEGAQVGPSDFTFRYGPDNIPPEEVPRHFTAVLSGHIHRAQQLTRGLDGRPLLTPVIYPGSIERTSFAERFEEKTYVMIKLVPGADGLSQVVEFHKLPSRPMIKIDIPTETKSIAQIQSLIRTRLTELDPDAIARLELTGPNADQFQGAFTAATLRALAPRSMNVSWANGERYASQRTRSKNRRVIS